MGHTFVGRVKVRLAIELTIKNKNKVLTNDGSVSAMLDPTRVGDDGMGMQCCVFAAPQITEEKGITSLFKML